VPTNSTYYKISANNGWQEIPFGDNDGDDTITLTLTDGDAFTDADGKADGLIEDPGALATTSSDVVVPVASTGGGGGGGCFVTAADSKSMGALWVMLMFFLFGVVAIHTRPK